MKSKRQSNLELLKIIAIVLITFSHCLPFYGNGDYAGMLSESTAFLNFNSIISLFFRHLGQVGNILFVICSAWFLVNNDNVKIDKVLNILFKAFILSIIEIILCLVLGINVELRVFIKMLTPTLSEINWFVGCYLLLYILHGALNKIINGLEKRALFSLCFFLFIVNYVIAFINTDYLYYTRLGCFITIYLIIGYLKKYKMDFMTNSSKKTLLLSIILYTISIFSYLIIATKVSACEGRALKLASTNYPLMIIMSLLIFKEFVNVDLKYNSVINSISSYSLLYYLITENIINGRLLRPRYFEFFYLHGLYNYLLLWIIALVIITSFVGLILSFAFEFIFERIINTLSIKISNELRRFVDRVYSRFY